MLGPEPTWLHTLHDWWSSPRRAEGGGRGQQSTLPLSILFWLRKLPHSELRSKRAGLGRQRDFYLQGCPKAQGAASRKGEGSLLGSTPVLFHLFCGCLLCWALWTHWDIRPRYTLGICSQRTPSWTCKLGILQQGFIWHPSEESRHLKPRVLTQTEEPSPEADMHPFFHTHTHSCKHIQTHRHHRGGTALCPKSRIYLALTWPWPLSGAVQLLLLH